MSIFAEGNHSMLKSSTFGPLRHPAFALLLAGSLLSNLGNAIESVGAAWDLTVAGQPADVIALVQTAFNLPMLLLALPAGAWADIIDRRRIMLTAQIGMFTVSLLLLLLVSLDWAGPAAVVGLTGLLAAGVACFNPALAASIRSTVSPGQLAAAIALNILVFNAARTIGPAFGGGIVAVGGPAAAFLINACSYMLVIVVLWRWPGEPKPRRSPSRPRLVSTIAEGLRVALSVPELRAILCRALTFTFAGAAAWALMPVVASDLFHEGSATFGLLLGALGAGAVVGAASSTKLRNRLSAEAILRVAGLSYGICCMAVALQPSLPLLLVLLVIAGAGWVQALSSFAVAAQLWAPHDVVGRIVALVSSLTFGGIALGSWVWGHVAEDLGVSAAFLLSGAATALTPLLGFFLPMPNHREPV